jgi:hypothetical protein
MMRLALALTAIVAIAGVLASACGGSGSADDEFPRVVSLGKGDVFPAILNDSVVTGDNRLVLALTGKDDQLIRDASVHLRFFDLNDGTHFSSETDARFVPIEMSYIDEQAPTPEPTDAGAGGIYVAHVTFDRTGEWGLKAAVSANGQQLEEATFRFNVLDASSEPGIGDPAPASRQATLDTVGSIEEIDSSFPSRPAMHDITIADALQSGEPLVVAFATPAYCRSRTCAPVMDTIMDPLAQRYGSEAKFIHVEPYVLRDLRSGFQQNAVPATREWGIQSEPWVFVVGRDGRIAAKFQGPAALDEVESALQAALQPTPDSGSSG